jgi:hypothetical protein
VLAPNYLLMPLIRVYVTQGVTLSFKTDKKANFHWLWANFRRPLTNGSFSDSYSASTVVAAPRVKLGFGGFGGFIVDCYRGGRGRWWAMGGQRGGLTTNEE